MQVSPKLAIRDIEGLLTCALGLSSNVNRSGFVGADQWIQIKEHQVDEFLALARRRQR
jgi:hypothetical protein